MGGGSYTRHAPPAAPFAALQTPPKCATVMIDSIKLPCHAGFATRDPEDAVGGGGKSQRKLDSLVWDLDRLLTQGDTDTAGGAAIPQATKALGSRGPQPVVCRGHI